MSKKVKKKVPELRFSGFKGDWDSKYLGEIGDFKNGFNADKEAFGTGTEFINLMDIFGKTEIQKTYLDRVEIHEKQLEQYKIRKGDVLFVRSSVKREGVGQSCLINDDFENTVYSGFIIRFREKDNTIYHLYKKYCFSESSFRKELLSLATSSANTNINQDSLSQIPLFYPPIAEQKKIASFLGTIDTRLTQLCRKRELLQTYKRGVMQKIFTHKIGVRKKKEIPEFRFSSFVGDWKARRFCDFITKKSINASEDIPLFSLTIENGVTEKTERYERSFLVKDEEEAYKLVEPDDFVYNPMNLRFGALARNKRNHLVKVSKYYDVFSVDNSVNLRFFEFFIKNNNSIQYYNHMAEGSLIEKKRLHFADFLEFKFLLPSLEEQEKIAHFLTAIDRKIEAISRQIDRTEQFKKGLLQKMFI